jgi:PPK2 family polyphosphate:nucleotide phosphotransferase
MAWTALTRKPGEKFDLAAIDPRSTPGIKDKEAAAKDHERLAERLNSLQQRLYAGGKHALLMVLQGMDASGKDGAIRHVAGAFDPQGVSHTAFKVPTSEELAHDFLWRIHKAVPGRGTVGVFNRSHYEDVGVVRVKKLVPEAVWKKRYEQINRFERLLADNRVVLLKFFLHISPEEQAERLGDRQHDPEKRWKFNPGDLEDRNLWGEFMAAYGEAITRCNTAWAPWYVIPSDRKWYRNWAVSRILVETMEGLDLAYPPVPADLEEHEIPAVNWPPRRAPRRAPAASRKSPGRGKR